MKNKECNDEAMREFKKDLLAVIEFHETKVPLGEMIMNLILVGTSISLFCSPSLVEALKAINASIMLGIEDYEEKKRKSNAE